jgi:protein ImuA
MSTLNRQPHKSQSDLTFATAESDSLSIPYNRTNELCGPSRRTLALMLASQMQGPILWIKPSWNRENLNAQGAVNFVNPGRITFVEPRRTEDVLWCMEEALRSGCIPTVIAECDTPPPLTPIRRLHLATEQGAQMSKTKLLPLVLTPADGGAQGVETRWHMFPRHENPHNRWQIERRRARMFPPATWTIQWHKQKPHAYTNIPPQGIAAE